MQILQVSALLVVALATYAATPSRVIADTFEIERGSTGDPPGRLQSAFLLREAAFKTTEYVDETTRLNRHFDLVNGMLIAQTPVSLHVALSRLERAAGADWSPALRREVEAVLLRRRIRNLQRLVAYRDRGSYPRNEGHAPHAVPIFVDNHDTACAVGHLMRESGWGAAVEAIRSHDNLAYVTDVDRGPLVAWVLTSGLTQEEAALIQPGYQAPRATHTMADLLKLEGVIERDGLRFSNFSMVLEEGWPASRFSETGLERYCRTNPVECDDTFVSFGALNDPLPSEIGVAVGQDEYLAPDSGDVTILPYGTHWLFFGAGIPRTDYGETYWYQDGFELQGDQSIFELAEHVEISFDVEAINPLSRIQSVTLGQSLFIGGFRLENGSMTFHPQFPRKGSLDLVIRDEIGKEVLVEASLRAEIPFNDRDEGWFNIEQRMLPGAPPRVSVFAEAHVLDTTLFDGFVLHVELVPEPPAVFVLVFTAALAVTMPRATGYRRSI